MTQRKKKDQLRNEVHILYFIFILVNKHPLESKLSINKEPGDVNYYIKIYSPEKLNTTASYN